MGQVVALNRRRWPKGTYRRLKSSETLREFVGPEDGKKMSGRTLARYAGVHPSFISHLLAGRRKTCTPVIASRIAGALEVPMTILFDPTVTPSKQQIEARERRIKAAGGAAA